MQYDIYKAECKHITASLCTLHALSHIIASYVLYHSTMQPTWKYVALCRSLKPLLLILIQEKIYKSRGKDT